MHDDHWTRCFTFGTDKCEGYKHNLLKCSHIMASCQLESSARRLCEQCGSQNFEARRLPTHNYWYVKTNYIQHMKFSIVRFLAHCRFVTEHTIPCDCESEAIKSARTAKSAASAIAWNNCTRARLAWSLHRLQNTSQRTTRSSTSKRQDLTYLMFDEFSILIALVSFFNVNF